MVTVILGCSIFSMDNNILSLDEVNISKTSYFNTNKAKEACEYIKAGKHKKVRIIEKYNIR